MHRPEGITHPWNGALAKRLAGAWAPIAAAARRFAESRARAQAVKELERLSDRALYDIGLHRGQIRAAVYGVRS